MQKRTRMHSNRMRTMHCSSCLSYHACPHHAHPPLPCMPPLPCTPPAMRGKGHACPLYIPYHTHSPVMHGKGHACPLYIPHHTHSPAMHVLYHACPLPHMPSCHAHPNTYALPATHGPHLLHMSPCHSCPLPCLPLFATYAPLSPCMPPPCTSPTTHAPSPCPLPGTPPPCMSPAIHASHHTHLSFTMHASPFAMHVPLCHACPPSPCMPPL